MKSVKEFFIDLGGKITIEFDDLTILESELSKMVVSHELSNNSNLTPQFFGAKGDGIQDDTQYLQTWLNFLANTTNSHGYIPSGTYNVTSNLYLNTSRGLRIVGDGMDQSIIRGIGNISDLISIDSLQNLVLDNFRITSDGNSLNGLVFQHTGPTTSVRHLFKNLHISNFKGTGFIANNMELSNFEHIYIYGCLDGFIANNTGNGSGFSASCVSNKLNQVRVLNCKGKGMEFSNWAMSTLDHCQVLQCGKTIASDGSGTLTPGHIAQINITGSCNGFTLIHPDVEEYATINGSQVFERLTTGIQFSGTNHKLECPNLFGLNNPWKAVSANDFIVEAPRIVQCTNNGTADAGCSRVVAIIPRQFSNSGNSTSIIGGGSSGYTNSPAAISFGGAGVTFRLPKLTTVQRDSITGYSSGDEIFNTTLNKKQFYNGTSWETVTSS